MTGRRGIPTTRLAVLGPGPLLNVKTPGRVEQQHVGGAVAQSVAMHQRARRLPDDPIVGVDDIEQFGGGLRRHPRGAAPDAPHGAMRRARNRPRRWRDPGRLRAYAAARPPPPAGRRPPPSLHRVRAPGRDAPSARAPARAAADFVGRQSPPLRPGGRARRRRGRCDAGTEACAESSASAIACHLPGQGITRRSRTPPGRSRRNHQAVPVPAGCAGCRRAPAPPVGGRRAWRIRAPPVRCRPAHRPERLSAQDSR